MHDRTFRRVSRSVPAALALAGLVSGVLPACAPGAWSPPQASAWRRSDARAGRSAYGLAFEPEIRAGSPAARATPAATAAPKAPVEADPVAVGLFARNCATCHGIDGSGQGPSVLDRPARNFKDGGFSFGNTT